MDYAADDNSEWIEKALSIPDINLNVAGDDGMAPFEFASAYILADLICNCPNSLVEDLARSHPLIFKRLSFVLLMDGLSCYRVAILSIHRLISRK